MRVLANLVQPMFIAGFLISFVQYYIIYAKRRVWNGRFAMMIAAAVGVAFYAAMRLAYPQSTLVTEAFFALAVVHVAASIYMLRHMPPREFMQPERRQRR